jgi:WXG100 family type VII secretion target
MALYNIDTTKLRKEANDLNKTKNDLFNTLNEIKNQVAKIPKYWDDDVAVEFKKRFDGLSDDFQNYDKILGDYVTKANEIADEYDKANADAKNQLSDLLSDIQ